MNTLLLFNTMEDFNTWHAQVNSELGYPNQETKTDQYTEGNLHPDAEDDRVVCWADDNCPSELLSGQTEKTLEWVKGEGWFPDPEE